MSIEIHTFSYKKIHLKMATILSQPQCVNSEFQTLSVLNKMAENLQVTLSNASS